MFSTVVLWLCLVAVVSSLWLPGDVRSAPLAGASAPEDASRVISKAAMLCDTSSGFDDRSLFNSLNDLSSMNPGSLQAGLVASQLRKRWMQDLPVADVQSEVASRNRTDEYRTIMLSVLASDLKQRLRGGSVPRNVSLANAVPSAGATTLADTRATLDVLLSVVSDRTESVALRTGAMSAMGALFQIIREQGALDHDRKQETGARFTAIFSDTTEASDVRGRAAKAIRCLDDRRALPALRAAVARDTEPEFVQRCAVVALAKMGDRGSLMAIRERLDRAESLPLFATTAYAMGLFRDPSLLKPVLRNASRFSGEATQGLLWQQRDVIRTALGSDDRDQVLDGISAVLLGDIQPLKPELFRLLAHTDSTVRRRAVEALFNIGSKADWKKLVELTRNEQDSYVLEVLEDVRIRAALELRRPVRDHQRDLPAERGTP